MQISANTIFHFTRNKETLLSILESCLYPRLCVEKNYMMEDFDAAIPMCCFCDIPLSQISDHVSKYGCYAIGLKKEWAITNGITPVMYVHKESIPLKNFEEQFNVLQNLSEEKASKWSLKMETLFLYNALYMKPYQGLQVIDEKEKLIRFYDEREWRYIPPCFHGKYHPFLFQDEFNDSAIRERINSLNEQYGLHFSPSDINFIIVQSEDEILDFRNSLLSIDWQSPQEEVELLTTRLLSVERIKEDM